MGHFTADDFLPKAEAKKTELKEETNASGGTDTPLGDPSKNIPPESGGSDTGDTGESKLPSTGTGGEQTNTSDNVGGLGDASADAPSQNTADGAGSTTSKPSTKKGAKPTGK